jgi:GT2 family glycosyltransferase/glycosyltransferase involved in cell wall biosynthesis
VVGRVYAALARLLLPGLKDCFDPAYYLNRYPDVQRSGMDPLAHFLLYGAREGRQPDTLFDVQYYLSNNPDIAAAGANPLVHFLRYGWQEGRRPNPLFDAAFYTAQYPDRHLGNANPFVDYVARRRKGEHPRGWLPFSLPSKSYQVATRKIPVNKTAVDIIIPVYSGLQETRECLESVLGSACKTPYQIVLVNDQAPDPELGRYLREMAESHGLTLIENPENLGFAGSVNRGLELHVDRDVVLLNNDTKVANDWLDRLAAAAYSGHTGTATPFSNNATICTYRVQGETAEELDQVFREVNAGHRVRIPTGVGFCMYIRRDCLTEVGEFRAGVFGKGYGEENDFCLRALYKGWDHVLAADVFVYHAGETSFGSEAEARRKAGVETLHRLYPEYGRMIAEHERRDPARPYRIAVSGWRMRQSGKPMILAISHHLGGGVDQYVRELWDALARQAGMLILTPTNSGAVVLRNLDPEDEFSVAFDIESEYQALVELLRYCGVSRLHVQHLMGHTLDVLRLRHDLGAHLDLSGHDYFVICPQVTLTDPAGRYCGEPDAAGCNECLAGRPPWPRLDIGAWREKYGAVVAGADRVIAPSRDTADRLGRYFPEANIVVAAHPSGKTAEVTGCPGESTRPMVIAVLGVMTRHKGIERLRAVAAEARRRNLPLQFVLTGYVDQRANQLPGGREPFHSTGPYNKDQLPGLLREAGAQVVWFPAQWPETFSYTLSACLEMGMPVIAPDIGAFAERLAGRSWSWIVPWDWDTGRMLEFFLSVRREHFLTGLAPPVPAARGVAAGDFYPVSYLSCDNQKRD